MKILLTITFFSRRSNVWSGTIICFIIDQLLQYHGRLVNIINLDNLVSGLKLLPKTRQGNTVRTIWIQWISIEFIIFSSNYPCLWNVWISTLNIFTNTWNNFFWWFRIVQQSISRFFFKTKIKSCIWKTQTK